LVIYIFTHHFVVQLVESVCGVCELTLIENYKYKTKWPLIDTDIWHGIQPDPN